MSDLRQRVAMAIEASLHHARLHRTGVGYLPEADAAIALVLEEAARVAEASPDSHWGPTIAAAIRKLGEDMNLDRIAQEP